MVASACNLFRILCTYTQYTNFRWNTRGYFAQHHVDTLTPTMTPVAFLASKYPGKSEQEYRGHLGNFQISGMTGYEQFLYTNSAFDINLLA